MKICEPQKCVGCFSCVNSCPKGCISMAENEIGHICPVIDENRCVNCGICKNVCPVNFAPQKQTLNKAFAAYSLNEEEHKTSTSGGVAAEFSRYIIETGGVVYGASSKIDKGISHIRVDSPSELYLLKGSKYVHSYINDSFSMAKKDLESGLKVLFTGTPCQIAGFRAYLKKDYENLITVDLICHGVPSQRLLFENLKGYYTDGNLISFRQPEGSIIKVAKEDGGIAYKKSSNKDLYYAAFYKNLYLRDSCYSCRYSSPERVSDITIGDFWGLGVKKAFGGKMDNGVSVVLPNTEKGMMFWNGVKDIFFYEERDFEEAIAGNHNLKKATVPHKKNNLFKEKYPSKGFKKATLYCLYKDIIKLRFIELIYKNKKLFKFLFKLLKR